MTTPIPIVGDPVVAAAMLGEAQPATLRERARDVAGQFEAVFVQQMVSAMRSSADGLGGSMFGVDAGSDTYSTWFDSCMAEHITHGRGIGLASLIEKNILQHAGEAAGHG